MTAPRRVAIVGTGSRARLYTRGLAARSGYAVAALCDPSPTRMAYHNRLLASAGRPAASAWSPDRFAAMLAGEDVAEVVVATVDEFHHEYIVAAVEAGCRVVTEKPMTIDGPRCQAILDATARAGNSLAVAFNYRYNPVHERLWRLLREQAIGEVLSVHFEWLLDVRHGADYFRRWHRDKASSGGLMVHKASHHFDLVNWWLDSEPDEVFGYGRLGFYGAAAGRRHGLRRDYARAHGSPAAADDPFALDLAGNDGLRELYLEAEADSGYIRDRNVFDGDISIEDDMAVLVRYASGATMSYHLTTYSPWEGYRVMINGSAGRLELEVTESAWQPRRDPVASPGGAHSPAIHGEVAMANAGGAMLLLRRPWGPPEVLPVTVGHSGHGGGDERMLTALYGPADAAEPVEPGDAARQRATERDGALALAVGAAANECFRTGRPVKTADLVPGLLSFVRMKGTLTKNGHTYEATQQDIEQAAKADAFFWLDLDIHDPGPDDDVMGLLTNIFHFHPVAVEAANRFGQRPRIDDYDDFVHVVTFGVAADGKDVAEVHCFITKTSIITLHQGNCPALGTVCDRISGHHSTGVAPPQVAIFYLIMDTLIDSFFPVLSDLDDSIDSLEGAILKNPTEEQLGTLFGMKQQIMTIRKVITPQRDMIDRLNSGTVEIPGMTEAGVPYFRNLYDHLIRISDMVDEYRDLISGAMDTHLSMVSNRLNVVMKQLAIIATIFLPLGFLTGFFGQNFAWLTNHLQVGFGYFLFLGIGSELVAIAALVLLFKRRGWLGSGPTA